jgi:serine/threonine protein phosphatase PrpC
MVIGGVAQAISYWLATTTSFPCERESAIKAIRTLQSALYDTYGSAHMDETSDFTPETSLIAVELDGHHVRIVSYGDCRLLIARHGIPRFTLDTHETWLGAFSHLGLRQRIPVEQATIFAEQQLGSGDRLCLYTDGVDECVYNTPTISIDTLATLTDTADSEDALKTILSRVFKCGAEDNATLAIIAR